MNKLVKEWLNREGIDINKIINKVDCSLLKADKVNPIVSKYGVYHETEDKKISIGDIIGFEDDGQTIFQGIGKDIFEELGYLFNSESDQYASRSISMLNYSREEVLNSLENSFEEQPILVKDVGDGRFSINGNGKHRYTLLKAFYLSELAEIDQNDVEKIQLLKDKYTIPVKLNRLDYNQTYSNFFISSFGFYDVDSTNIYPEPQASSLYWKGKKYISYKESSLIKFAKRIIKENKNIFNKPYKGKKEQGQIIDKKHIRFSELKSIIDDLNRYYKSIPSFNKYINNYMKDTFLSLEVNNIKNEQYPSLDDV